MLTGEKSTNQLFGCTNPLIFGLIAFGLSIAGMCACLVGILLVIPLLYIAHMYIYLKLSGQPVAQIARAA